MRAGGKTELAEAPAMKIAAENWFGAVRQRSARPVPKVRAGKRIIKIPPLHVEEHVSKKTKTFLFSPSFLNCCARNPGVAAGNEILRNLSHSYYDKSLPAVPGLCPVDILQPA
jgi:hypothetical protein